MCSCLGGAEPSMVNIEFGFMMFRWADTPPSEVGS